tara:strand:+ start:1131 stop:1673 length:543 start_codon:yes stop_codon:yes gene_type:complete
MGFFIEKINLTLANPGLLIFLIFLPVILLSIDRNFRKRFFKVHTTKSQILLDALIGAMYFIIIFYAATLEISKSFTIFFLGAVVYKIGIGITFWGYDVFFKNKPNIIKKGPYKFSRNPTYFFTFIAILGIAIITTSKILLLLVFIQFALTHQIILQEEKYLLKNFKKQYKDYSDQVPRYI